MPDDGLVRAYNKTESDLSRATGKSAGADSSMAYAGTHLLIDFWGARLLTDAAAIEHALRGAAEAARATVLHSYLHVFGGGGGVSGVVVLAESHITIHTWPEKRLAAIDIFVCGPCDPHRALQVLNQAFAPENMQVTEAKRGPFDVNWFEERLYVEDLPRGYAQRMAIENVIWQERTAFQDLLIFDSRWFGRVLVLDGAVQLAEADEFAYHEMLVHVPMFAHGGARHVLIIGGGDGGALREALRHPIERATVVDIDERVVSLCRQYLPAVSGGAFDDPRCQLLIADGNRFVAESEDRFDVIIVDSPDPIGPAEALFSEAFYAGCRRCLADGGVLVIQNGSPFLHPEEVSETQQRLRPHFSDASVYLTAVPSYVCAPLALAWASNDVSLRQIAPEVLARRQADAGIATRYYAADVHRAAFALPPYIRKLVD